MISNIVGTEVMVSLEKEEVCSVCTKKLKKGLDCFSLVGMNFFSHGDCSKPKVIKKKRVKK